VPGRALSKPSLSIQGERALIRKLKRLGNVRQLKKIARRATNAGGQALVKAVRAEWPRDTGFSAKSVTKKVISTRAGYSAIVGVNARAETTGPDGKPHIPSKIDHLIEFGFQHRNGQTVPAHAPLRRGYNRGKAQAEATFKSKVAVELEKEAGK
jgi:hypothetical protein